MRRIDKNELKEIIASHFLINSTDVINPTICVPVGAQINLYSDAIERGSKSGMHVLFCKNYEKIDNVWSYDLEESEIFYVSPKYFINLRESYIKEFGKLPIGLLRVPMFGTEYLSYANKIEEVSNNPVDNSSLSDILHDPDMDRDYTKMTKIEYAAILLKVPCSGTNWIDSMIKISNNNKK